MELVLNEGSDPQDLSDSGSEENIVDSGEEFASYISRRTRETAILTSSFSSLGSVQPVGSNFFFFFFLLLDSSRFAVGTEKGI